MSVRIRSGTRPRVPAVESHDYANPMRGAFGVCGSTLGYAKFDSASCGHPGRGDPTHDWGGFAYFPAKKSGPSGPLRLIGIIDFGL